MLDLAGEPLTTQLDPDDYRLVWVADYYDGVLSALIARGDDRFVLELHDRDVIADATDQPWRWLVLRLAPAALARLEASHDDFAHHVGTHWCSHAWAHAARDQPRDFDGYYRRSRAEPELTRAYVEIVGWLDAPPRRGDG